MAISAERFKFLDKETNVATKEFTELVDNQIYNSVSEVVDTALEAAKDAEKLLDKVAESMNELKDMIMSGLESVGEAIKSALNAAIDAIGKLELPQMIKDLFKTLKDLDLSGVKDFLKDLLHVGASFLCNNLDFLKMFMLGYALNGNILGGLLTALLMSWLDRFCKGFSKEDVSTSSKTEKLEMMIQPKGLEMNASNAFSNFTNTYADYIKATSPINLATAPTQTQFLDDIIAGSVSSSINTLRSAEITTTQKKSYMDTITGALSTFNQGSQQFANLLNAKGQLAGVPLISVQRRETQLNFSNLSDQLGSMAKNLVQVDLSSVNKFSFNELEKGLFNKVTEFKNNSQANRDLHTRNLNSGSFSDFNFNDILPSLSTEERDYLTQQPGSGKAHRLHDMHPTTSSFLMS